MPQQRGDSRPHGVWNTYSEWGCRCEACTQVGSDQNRYYREAAK